jgi:hypothetical protein
MAKNDIILTKNLYFEINLKKFQVKRRVTTLGYRRKKGESGERGLDGMGCVGNGEKKHKQKLSSYQEERRRRTGAQIPQSPFIKGVLFTMMVTWFVGALLDKGEGGEDLPPWTSV